MRLITLTAVALFAWLLPGTVSVHAQDVTPRPMPALVSIEAGARPVVLDAAGVRIDVGAGQAQTTLRMTFANPNARVLEGNLQFPLRPGQQVVGFALDVDGHMRQAVPVEKTRGRQVFEAIERRGADPGLLEQTVGDAFRLRIYPFPAGGTRRVSIALAETLPAGMAPTVTMPLQFAAELPTVDVEIHAGNAPTIQGLLRPVALRPVGNGAWLLSLSRGDFVPSRGITLVLPATARPAVQAQSLNGERYFVADVPVTDAGIGRASGTPAPIARHLPARIGLLWDSSLSGAGRAHDLEFALLDAYFRAAGTVDVSLLRVRDVVEPVRHFHVEHGDWSALRRELASTQYDGATSAGGWVPDPALGEYLLFGDGLFDYGDAPFPKFAPRQRLYTIRAGVAGDSMRLAGLAAARGGRAVSLDDSGDLPAATAALLDDAPRLRAIDGIGASDLLIESPDAVAGMLRIAGRLREANARLRLTLDSATGTREVTVDLSNAVESDLAARTWARYRLAQLQQDPIANRAAITALGSDFHLVTPQSSLIVLERAEDYLRYHIAPPRELATEYASLARAAADADALAHREQLASVREQWQARMEWWSQSFPKDTPATPRPAKTPANSVAAAADAAAAAAAQAAGERADAAQAPSEDTDAQAAAASAEAPVVLDSPAPMAMVMPTPPPAPAPAPARQADTSPNLDRVMITGSRIAPSELDPAQGATAQIALQPWRPDSEQARRLRLADSAHVYAVYLDERAHAPAGSAFHLDAAQVLFDKGQPALALRVLSNLAELDLDNRQVLRVLGYRLLQAGRTALAIPVLEQVLAMASDEPQSYRDLGLAYAALGKRQRAIDLLYEVVTGTWDGRFPGIEVTALAELNAIVATAPKPLDVDAIDPALRTNLPLGLRAVLSWDADNTDIDLWVTDPNGERAFYGHRDTYQGGHMSPDFTGGYGPEEFALRNPKPGIYKVEANYFGDRQQVLTGGTTLQLWLSTGFGTRAQQDKAVILRLKDKKDTIFVGEFEVN
jgi:tetratricopeptide (TPR) repeat protein